MTQTKWWISCAVAATVVLLSGPALAAPTLNQGNDFEMGTLQGWAHGPGTTVSPVNMETGGAGSDRFLQVSATGDDTADGRLFALNRSNRWTGNYKTSGVGAVTIDLKNFGAAPLSMRLAFEESGGTWYASANAFTLPADAAWHSTRFDLQAAEFTAIEGATPFDTGLTRVTEFRVLHASSVDYQGAAIASSFGMDNLLAVVPEPATAALGAMAAAGLLLRRPRGRSGAAR